MWLRLVIAVAVGGCITSQSVPCEDGRVCPTGTTCEETHHLCIVPDQATACNGLADNAVCTFASSTGTCHGGTCLEAVCGDGVVEGTEQCEADDLQGVAGCLDLGYYQDGPVTCGVDCRFDRSQCAGICGDGIVDPTHEACDAAHSVVVAQCNDPAVGFYNPGDVHCNAACQLDTSECTGSCGDGIVNGSEACDGEPPAIGCLGYGYDYGSIGCVRCGPSFNQCGILGWRDEQTSLASAARAMMGTSPTDVWASTFGSAYHTVNHVTRPFALNANDGATMWLHGNELFFSSSAGQVTHGVVASNGDVTFTTQTLPASAVVTRFSGTDTTTLYATALVIATGAISIYHYNGTTWTLAMAGPSTAPVVAFWVASANDMWLATNSVGTGVLWHWTGAWNTVAPPTTLTASSVINVIWGADATHVFFGGSLGVAEWNGAWTVNAIGLPIFAINGASASDVVAAGFSTLRFDGSFWDDVSAADGVATAIWDGGSIVYEAVQGSSGIHVAFTEGSAWEGDQLGSESATHVWDGAGTAVVGTSDTVYQRDATGAWVDVLDGYNAVDVWGFAGNDYWVTDSLTVQHYNGTWHDMTTNLTTAGNTGLLRIWGASSSDLWGVDAHTLFHWNGATWSGTASGHTLTGIHGTATNDIWASTADGVILHYNGATWSPMMLPTAQRIEDVWAIDATHVFAVGDQGTIMSWDGATWTLQPVTTSFTFGNVWGLTPTDVFALSVAGELFHYDGTGWGVVRPTDFLEGAGLGGDAEHIYLLGGDGVITLYRHSTWL